MRTQVWKLIGWLAAVGGWNRHPPLSTILPVSLTLSLMLVSFSREESSIFLPKDIPNCKMNRGENRVGLRKFSLSEMQIFIFFSSSFYDISPGMVGMISGGPQSVWILEKTHWHLLHWLSFILRLQISLEKGTVKRKAEDQSTVILQSYTVMCFPRRPRPNSIS